MRWIKFGDKQKHYISPKLFKIAILTPDKGSEAKDTRMRLGLTLSLVLFELMKDANRKIGSAELLRKEV